METEPSIFLPTIVLPVAPKIITISMPLPTGEIPSYIPMVVPPSDLQPPDGVAAESHDTANTGVRTLDIPVFNFKLPVPENAILITAGSTAVVSVAATLTATAIFKWCVTAMKPLIKKLLTWITKTKESGLKTE